MSKTWGFFFGGSGHGSESSCQISAYYKFFPGSLVCCRISTGLYRLTAPKCCSIRSFLDEVRRIQVVLIAAVDKKLNAVWFEIDPFENQGLVDR